MEVRLSRRNSVKYDFLALSEIKKQRSSNFAHATKLTQIMLVQSSSSSRGQATISRSIKLTPRSREQASSQHYQWSKQRTAKKNQSSTISRTLLFLQALTKIDDPTLRSKSSSKRSPCNQDLAVEVKQPPHACIKPTRQGQGIKVTKRAKQALHPANNQLSLKTNEGIKDVNNQRARNQAIHRQPTPRFLISGMLSILPIRCQETASCCLSASVRSRTILCTSLSSYTTYSIDNAIHNTRTPYYITTTSLHY